MGTAPDLLSPVPLWPVYGTIYQCLPLGKDLQATWPPSSPRPKEVAPDSYKKLTLIY